MRGAQNQNLPVLGQEDQNRKRKKPGDVDVAIDPSVLEAGDELSKEEVKRRFEAQRAEEKGQWGFQEDLSDMIAEESRKRQRRDEARRGGDGKDKKERSYRF